MYDPEAVYVTPFETQVYESQTVSLVIIPVRGVIVKFNVSVCVHPAAFNEVAVYVPDVVEVVRFTTHVYVPQAVSLVLFDDLLLIVRFKVAVCVHPPAFNDVAVYVPLALYVVPFHV